MLSPIRGGISGLESVDEPSRTLALGLAVEATAIKTKIVACLGSVVKRGLWVTLEGLHELRIIENSWLVTMRGISQRQDSRTSEYTMFGSLRMFGSSPQQSICIYKL